MTPEKHFDEWNELKKNIHSANYKKSFFEREIWWYHAGENIGREINGKGINFLRPILVIRKYGAESFFGVPLSSKQHHGRWYAEILVRGEINTALLSQAGSFSVNRLRGKIDRINATKFRDICMKMQELLFKTLP